MRKHKPDNARKYTQKYWCHRWKGRTKGGSTNYTCRVSTRLFSDTPLPATITCPVCGTPNIAQSIEPDAGWESLGMTTEDVVKAVILSMT